jgi:hypothetical protein
MQPSKDETTHDYSSIAGNTNSGLIIIVLEASLETTTQVKKKGVGLLP